MYREISCPGGVTFQTSSKGTPKLQANHKRSPEKGVNFIVLPCPKPNSTATNNNAPKFYL